MWGEIERSPALAAPGSNNYGNVGNRSTGHTDGKTAKENQALSDAQFELVKNYLPLAYSLTGPYHGKGQSHEELRAGAENGLLRIARACIRDLIKRRGYKKPFRRWPPFSPVKYPCLAYTAEEIAAAIKGRKDLFATAESRIEQGWWNAHKRSCVYWMGGTTSHYRFKNDGPPKFQRWPR